LTRLAKAKSRRPNGRRFVSPAPGFFVEMPRRADFVAIPDWRPRKKG
jgi:hypothetical protein